MSDQYEVVDTIWNRLADAIDQERESLKRNLGAQKRATEGAMRIVHADSGILAWDAFLLRHAEKKIEALTRMLEEKAVMEAVWRSKFYGVHLPEHASRAEEVRAEGYSAGLDAAKPKNVRDTVWHVVMKPGRLHFIPDPGTEVAADSHAGEPNSISVWAR